MLSKVCGKFRESFRKYPTTWMMGAITTAIASTVANPFANEPCSLLEDSLIISGYLLITAAAYLSDKEYFKSKERNNKICESERRIYEYRNTFPSEYSEIYHWYK